MKIQTHLKANEAVDLGSFYTPKNIVEEAYKLFEKNNIQLTEFVLLDSSCGYGDFFIKNLNYIGADIDSIALSKTPKGLKTILTNSLEDVSRKKFGIKDDDSLIVIGNPPYNDRTSLVKSHIKTNNVTIDKELKHRDLGISFLRSYEVLNPEFVCVLHPLSYLIKESNFKALKKFKANYKLKDSVIVSSEIFSTKANSFFPIIIALYKKDQDGMNYDFIKAYKFKTIDGYSFKLNDFDFIGNYVSKYPNHKDPRKEVAYFYTLRDINALKRSQTFQKKQTNNSIKVFQDNLKYYYYIHHFKNYARSLPYYFGNLEVFIDNPTFLKSYKSFMSLDDNKEIKQYFQKLFNQHINVA